MLNCVFRGPITAFAAGGGPVNGLSHLSNSRNSAPLERAPVSLPGQSSLLLRDVEWDGTIRFEELDMPPRIRGSLLQLFKEMTFERHSEETLRRGLDRLRQLIALGSPAASDNSLFEYLSYQVFAAITTLKSASLLEDFVALLADPYSLFELTTFCKRNNLIRAFDLTGRQNGQTKQLEACVDYLTRLGLPSIARRDLETGMRALAHNQGSGKYSAGIEQDLRELSPDRIANILFLCCQDGARYRWLLEGLKVIRNKPFRLLLFLRLLQNIDQVATLHKVLELVSFPWEKSEWTSLDTYNDLGPDQIAGSVHTAFSSEPLLIRGIHHLMRAHQLVDKGTLKNRHRRMEEKIKQKATSLRTVNAKSISLLLSLQPTEESKSLADSIRAHKIEVEGLSPEAMEQLNAARKAKNPDDTGTSASFRVPQNKDERPALLLPEFGGPYSPQEIGFMALHEACHLRQVGVYGPQWIGENLITAEMDAWSWDLALRLVNGDDSFFQRFAALSPISFALGLQNGLEQVYARHRKLPA